MQEKPSKGLFSEKKILVSILFIIADLTIYLLLGLLMMQYDDFYDETKGGYWSWDSMSSFDRMVFVSLQFWNIINILIVLYLAYRGYKYFKLKNE